MAYGFTTEVQGVSHVKGNLDEMGRRAVNAQPVMEEWLDQMRKAEKAQFASGKGWAPKKSPGKLGVKSGKLLASLTIEGAAGQISKATDTYAVFGSSLPHAHLFDKGHGKQPPRQLINIRPTDRKSMKEAVEDYVMKGAND